MELFTSINNRILIEKKGQAWSLDLVVAMLIFFSAVIILFFYSMNYMNQADRIISDMNYEANVASDIILSPEGILSNGKINQTKLEEFNNQVNNDYNSVKKELNLNYDFYFTFSNLEINDNSADYIGRMNSSEIKNRIKLDRVAVYNNKILNFEIYLWDE